MFETQIMELQTKHRTLSGDIKIQEDIIKADKAAARKLERVIINLQKAQEEFEPQEVGEVDGESDISV